MRCWKCKSEISVNEIFRTTECPVCHADLHSCKACDFYAPGNHFDCKETVEDLISDKEKANFCDYFRAAKNISGNGTDSNKKADDAKKAFAALFGD